MFASYTALDLANSITVARGRARYFWLLGGAVAMGVGIWSMHFVGMLAFSFGDLPIAYETSLLILSIVVAIAASALAFWIISQETVSHLDYLTGSLVMGGAISGMHYIGIASMRMAATWEWNYILVTVSVIIAVVASFVALQLAVTLRSNLTLLGFIYRGFGGVIMGIAVSGMHYTAMSAMTFSSAPPVEMNSNMVLATSVLAVIVIGSTLLVLVVALVGSVVDRAIGKQMEIMRARDEFLAIASHELKTPLTILKLQVQMRQKMLTQGHHELFTPDKLSDLLESDSRQISRIAHLVEDMFDSSRIANGRLKLNPEKLDLTELVREVVVRSQTQLMAYGSELIFEWQEPLLGYFDRFRMDQVVTNLLTNAVKYGSHRPIQIRVGRFYSLFAEIVVEDQGIGIAPEDQVRVFERFERAISSDEVSGFGLGLSIAKQIVEDHKGTITVKSELGRGSIFTVRLPIHTEPFA
ncbi:MAG: hypothetical protein EOP09_03285 [Proteobacteria bacterium]|nr:MAG: hypothetical protein EOP09_03285 [Pseudomonadota bacterium]